MKYKDLIQFDPIDEIIKFSKLDNEDYRSKIVGNFVCSRTYEEYIIPQICATLDLSSTKETKGIQIVGNYGTGKSHLMSLFTIIAEDASNLSLLKSERAKERLKTIAGKYKVFRFELGNNQELWDIVTYKIDGALEQWGVDYRISDDDRRGASYSEKLEQMMAAFEEVYPDKGFIILGRKDNVINSGGIKIQAEEVEKLLRPFISVPFVITSVPDQRLGQAVTLLIEGRADTEEIENRLQTILTPYYRPKYILTTDCIPQTGNGKVNRAECSDLARKKLVTFLPSYPH